jgi:hypothetical protein
MHDKVFLMRGSLVRSAFTAGALALAACGGGGSGGSPVPTRSTAPTPTPTPTKVPAMQLPTHVVVVIQENRSFDNLFQGYPGADTQNYGLNQSNEKVPLKPVALDAPFDVEHEHTTFVAEYAAGRMNGWPLAHVSCNGAACKEATPYAYVRHSDVKPYWNLAEQFGLADEMLQANEGPSFAAHQYLIAAQSGHPWAMTGIPFPQRGACGVPGNKVAQIDMRTPYPGIIGNVEAPCKDYGTVLDLLVDKGFTWRYYTPFQSYLYNAPFAIRHIYFGPTASNDVIPEFSILTDIKSHHLANVSYVVSHLQLTDHPGVTSPNGPYWIATLANAIFENPYYKNNTVMFVTWDDWGGFFDHVVPRHPDGLPNDPYEYGFRVPLIAISPFVRTPHFVDHTPRDQTAIVHFIETNFGLRTLGELDAKTDDLSSMFDFSRSALPYTNVDTNGWVPNDALQYPIEQGVD